ncbi:hypothetical protein POVWA2_053310 [Plasmodium ovale wallikeri]|uniref:Uncharacterized protein n=1 Tax=Plasmodium ovale wallikeri TaxID=864142 RepID=A0A1A8ZRN1_PLAOA|nr:hypothetical protein POVWA1_054080 [Plasmodium ovale wallikeri]SBT47096.1 hypothetical protein POVWA2_053310 [Plasmodium ovale wallikeri]
MNTALHSRAPHYIGVDAEFAGGKAHSPFRDCTPGDNRKNLTCSEVHVKTQLGEKGGEGNTWEKRLKIVQMVQEVQEVQGVLAENKQNMT